MFLLLSISSHLCSRPGGGSVRQLVFGPRVRHESRTPQLSALCLLFVCLSYFFCLLSISFFCRYVVFLFFPFFCFPFVVSSFFCCILRCCLQHILSFVFCSSHRLDTANCAYLLVAWRDFPRHARYRIVVMCLDALSQQRISLESSTPCAEKLICSQLATS